jgi:hypothetical protein
MIRIDLKEKFYLNRKQVNRLFQIATLLLLGCILFFSCKREKKEVIGPLVKTATKNFKYETSFAASSSSVNFSTDSIWFNVSFNESVSWIVTLKSLNSKAEKIITGTSQLLFHQNSIWSGGNSGLYFFQPGDHVVAELTVFGVKEKLYDTILVTGSKVNYGSDVILWWDMDLAGVAKNGTVYWFDYYDGDSSVPTIGVGERLDNFLTAHNYPDPLQGFYRSMEGKDGLGSADYYIGAGGHTFLLPGAGFNTSLENVYLNFYLRKRTSTSAMGIALTSIHAPGDTSVMNYDVGKIDWEGWRLVSIKLSNMTADPKYPYPFDPAKIVKFAMNLEVHTNKGQDDTGFDMDMITFTKNIPFNPDRY